MVDKGGRGGEECCLFRVVDIPKTFIDFPPLVCNACGLLITTSFSAPFQAAPFTAPFLILLRIPPYLVSSSLLLTSTTPYSQEDPYI